MDYLTFFWSENNNMPKYGYFEKNLTLGYFISWSNMSIIY